MKVIVDANIVFSGILNTDGKIGDLLINSGKAFTFIAPEFLKTEIHSHYPKLVKISGLTLSAIQKAEFQVCKEINFISPGQIEPHIWRAAEKLVADIDPKDIQYIAYAKKFRCKLWSGDKELMRGLEKKGFLNFLNTEQLYELRKTLTKQKD